MVATVLVVAFIVLVGWGAKGFVTRSVRKGLPPTPSTSEEESLDEIRAASEKAMDAEDERFLQNLEGEEQARAEDKRAFLQAAKVVRGTILSTHTIGEYNYKPMLRIAVKIEAPSGFYTVETKMAVENTQLARFADGSTVDVYVDPNDPKRVHFGEGTDWVT